MVKPVGSDVYEVDVVSLAELLASLLADKLDISTRTVETHRNNIYRKLDISNIPELRYYMSKLNKS